jgi:uncharacterized membrane protein (UPF0136 family)
VLQFLTDINRPSFFNAPSGSLALYGKIALALLVSGAFFFALSRVSPLARRYVVGAFIFLAGGFYVLYFLWPQPINRQPGEKPNGFVEQVGFGLGDALPIVANFSNILGGFLIGLGIYSLLRIHSGRIFRQGRDWGYSVVLLTSATLMVVFGFWDWNLRKFTPKGSILDLQSNWQFPNYVFNLLFDGLFQQMDAAMFSLIAFYILSAAYRAFRIRSIEATILLATALIVMLSFMGLVVMGWDTLIQGNQTFTLTEIQKWLGSAFQKPAIRAIDLGVGIGALAMGLRLWLSLERQGD